MTDSASNDQTVRYGEYSVAANGTMNLPAEARRAIGIPRGGDVLIFGQPGRVVITPAPLPDELLAFAAERAVQRQDELAARDRSESDA